MADIDHYRTTTGFYRLKLIAYERANGWPNSHLPDEVPIEGSYPLVFDRGKRLYVRRGTDRLYSSPGTSHDLEPERVIECEPCGHRHIVSMRFR